MKDLCQYGNRPEDEWEILPWIPDPRPPFKIWAKPEQIAPFFLIPHHPYNKENFAENTKLCAAILTGPQSTEEGGEVCTLPGGEEVNFYQVIPLYEDEFFVINRH